MQGAFRFLKRLWAYAYEQRAAFGRHAQVHAAHQAEARREIHLTLEQANYDLDKHQFNTVASACMKILNALERASGGGAAAGPDGRRRHVDLPRPPSPIAPHITQALWVELSYGEDIDHAPWPEPDPAALEQDQIELVVQVNGKLRGNIRVAKTAAARTPSKTLSVANAAIHLPRPDCEKNRRRARPGPGERGSLGA